MFKRLITLLRQKSAVLSRKKSDLAIVLSVGLAIYLYKLGSSPLKRWDEAIYANAARFAIQDGHWIVPHLYWGGDPNQWMPFLHKPPLVYWLQAVSIGIFGPNTFAVRLPSALFTVALAVLVYQIAQELYNPNTGIAAALVLLVLPPAIYISHGGRSATTDMALVLFGTAFVWYMWKGSDNPQYLLPAGIFGALAVLSKGIAAAVFVVAVIPIVFARWRNYFRREFGIAVLTGLAVAVPWFVAAAIMNGDALYQQMIVDQFLARSAGKKGTAANTLIPGANFPYLLGFPDYFRAMRYLVVGSATGLLVGVVFRHKKSTQDLVVLWWMLAVPLTFGFAGGNHRWYLLPAIAPVAIIVGRVAATSVTLVNRYTERLVDRRAISYSTYVAAGLIVVLLAAAIPPNYPGSADPDSYMAEQRAAGNQLQELAGPSELVYVQDSVSDDTNLMVFSYYANRHYKPIDEDGLRLSDETRLAVVDNRTLSNLSREYYVVETVSTANATAVKFNNRTQPVSSAPHTPSLSDERKEAQQSKRDSNYQKPNPV